LIRLCQRPSMARFDIKRLGVNYMKTDHEETKPRRSRLPKTPYARMKGMLLIPVGPPSESTSLPLLSLCFFRAYQAIAPTRVRPATAPTAMPAIFPGDALPESPSDSSAVLLAEHALVHALVGLADPVLETELIIVVADTEDDKALEALGDAVAPGPFSVHRVPLPSAALSVGFKESAPTSRKTSGPV